MSNPTPPTYDAVPDVFSVSIPDENSASAFEVVFEERYHAMRERVIQQFERQYLLWLINRTHGNLTEAARLAAVNRTTLYRMMERNRLQRAPSLGWLTDVAGNPSPPQG